MAKAFEKDAEIRDDINIVTSTKVPKYTRRQVHQELYDLGAAEFEVLFQNKDPEQEETVKEDQEQQEKVIEQGEQTEQMPNLIDPEEGEGE